VVGVFGLGQAEPAVSSPADSSPADSFPSAPSSSRMRSRVGSPRARKYLATRSCLAGASGRRNLPLAEQPPDDQALLARAFWLLLDHGRPVEVGALADALQREPAVLAAAVDRLEQAGLTRRDPAGQPWAVGGANQPRARH
jgi:hypothetical protein